MATAGLLVFGLSAGASPIKYSIAGIGSGAIGPFTFTDQAYDITFIGDSTAGTTEIDPLESAQFSVAGSPIATLHVPTRIGLTGDGKIVYFSRSMSVGGSDLLDFHLGVTITDLNLEFFVAGHSVFGLEQFVNVDSSLGLISLNSSSDVIFSHTLAPPVPEPETYAMLLAVVVWLN